MQSRLRLLSALLLGLWLLPGRLDAALITSFPGTGGFTDLGFASAQFASDGIDDHYHIVVLSDYDGPVEVTPVVVLRGALPRGGKAVELLILVGGAVAEVTVARCEKKQGENGGPSEHPEHLAPKENW